MSNFWGAYQLTSVNTRKHFGKYAYLFWRVRRTYFGTYAHLSSALGEVCTDFAEVLRIGSVLYIFFLPIEYFAEGGTDFQFFVYCLSIHLYYLRTYRET